MKLADAVSGLLAAILGIAVVLYAWTFPPTPGQPVGPSLFPLLIGAWLIVAGAAMIAVDVRARARGVEALQGGPRALVRLDTWVRRPRLAARFALVITDLLFYALAVDRLGFLITAIVFLSVLFLAFGVRRARVLPLAAAVTLAVHYGFYTLLRVPLPWGLLEGIAW